MRTKTISFMATAILGGSIFCGSVIPARGQSNDPVALAGRVSSKEEGPMEGVLVSAKTADSTITVTVVSDEHGHYSFPRKSLSQGKYTIATRAVGYDLDDPGTIDVTPQKTATADLKLHKTSDLSAQLTSAEWINSFPGTQEQKDFLLSGCITCHTQERIAKSNHNADEWMRTYVKMSGYAPESQPTRPQFRPKRESDGGMESVGSGNLENKRKQAEWMATINLSATDKWTYPLQTFPRPTGRGTHVVITEYTLPRPNTMPHDAVVDSKGMIWYTDFGWQFLGRLDPRTGKTQEFPVPQLKANAPLGMLDLEIDKKGDFWMGQMLQGGFSKFDPVAQKFTSYNIPAEHNNALTQVNMVTAVHSGVDNKVWTMDLGARNIYRLDIETGKIETFVAYPDGIQGHTIYDVISDSRNNLYFTDIDGGYIGRVDSKTGKITFAPTPSKIAGKPSGPRRGHMDSQDRLWYADYNGNQLSMYDTRTGQFKEWEAPRPWLSPYDEELDKNGDVWSGGITSDRVLRLDTKTGQTTEYLMPRYTSMRDIFVDNSTNPVTIWLANNHGNSIVKVEPLD